jgi:hypothetical protein
VTTALGRLDDGTIIRADCPVQYPPHAPANMQGPAFDPIPAVVTRSYEQFDPHGLPPRPTGAPRQFAAGEDATFHRCEFLALRQAGAVRVKLSRDVLEAIVEEIASDQAIITRVTEALVPILIEQAGAVTQADLDAREERIREHTRFTPPEDRLQVVKQ